MRRLGRKIWDVPSDLATALTLLSAFFALGGVLGCTLAFQIDSGGSAGLARYVERFLTWAGTSGHTPSLLLAAWDTVRWPLLVFLLGFTTLGLLALPAVFAVRGFLLAFAIGSFVRLFGRTGGTLAFLIFGIPECAAVPVLFILGTQSWLASRALASRVLGGGKMALPYGKRYLLRCASCAGVLCICVFLEYVVVPALTAGAAGLLPPAGG